MIDPRAYEAGYKHGENSHAEAWCAALGDLLPDDMETTPTQVATFIRLLFEEHPPVIACCNPTCFMCELQAELDLLGTTAPSPARLEYAAFTFAVGAVTIAWAAGLYVTGRAAVRLTRLIR